MTAPAVRKHISLTEEERQKLASLGKPIPTVLREMVETFVKEGSDFRAPKAPETREAQVFLDPDTARNATEIARTTYGATLGDIIRYEIAQLE